MKIAFVIQRYGAEVLGGSEQLCRLVAERLSSQHEVEVLTTCARDYVTWKNDYAEGTDRVRGVTIRRFASARLRDIESFNKYSEWIFSHEHSRADEMEWLKQQGPWCPALIDYLRRNHQQYDILIFFTYLYATTVQGLEVNPGRSIVVPTAHDEPAIYLEIFKDVFTKPAALCYLTDSERQFVQRQFPDRPLLEELIGVGIDIPQQQPYPRVPDRSDEEAPGADEGATPAAPPLSADDGASDDTTTEFPSHLRSRGSAFRRRHRLHGPFALYGGRIDPGKGCEELLQYFGSYVKNGGDATLALMGAKLMALPEDPSVRFAGMLSESERTQALEAATVVICPSPYESLSLLALEALAVGTPLLVNARSEVLVEHCVRSNGGLWYADRDEFVECMNLLFADARLRSALGRNGRDYVRRNYRWDVVLGKYERIFAKVRNAR
ncbi:MAG TPA: glycosyltransferase [Vicinamibacterales bacterium]|nr:glycosyltransferase [Vicinamibacterales bacterium]